MVMYTVILFSFLIGEIIAIIDEYVIILKNNHDKSNVKCPKK